MNRKIVLLFIILVFAFILRFWQIDKIPPLLDPLLLSSRYLSAFLNLGSTLLVYFYVRNIFKKIKLALLSSWVFALLPWSIEQARIVSQPNNALFFFLAILLLGQRVKKKIFKAILYLLIPLVFLFIYPQFWLFKKFQFIPSLSSIINNLFYLLSADFLFFKNPTFWWGGVREVGIMHLSFLPFFVLGIFEFSKRFKWEILLWVVLLLFISSTSPFFTESREFFLVTPFISIMVALGIHRISDLFVFFTPGEPLRVTPGVFFLFLLIFFSLIYDIAQFWHYYLVHYPQQVESSREKIGEEF